MKKIINDFNSFPSEVRKYLIYHAIGSPLLIGWVILPVYIYITGYTVFDAGIFYTFFSLFSILSVYIIGKISDRITINYLFSISDFLESLAFFFFSISYGAFSSFFIFLGGALDRIAANFSPAFEVYNMEIFPENGREKMLVYYLNLPEFSQLVTFPIWGTLLGLLFPTVIAYRISFLALSVGMFFLSFLPIFYLKKVNKSLKYQNNLIKKRSIIRRLSLSAKIIFVIEILFVIAGGLIPSIVLINYIVNELGGNLFHVVGIEVAVSLTKLILAYIIKEQGREQRFKMIFIGFGFISIFPLLMFNEPNMQRIVLAYVFFTIGDTIFYPYYLSVIYEKIPKEISGEFFGLLQSIKKIISISLPLIAGLIAYKIAPLANYYFSFVIYLIIFFLFVFLKNG